jgi:hypothetical protein
MVLMYFLRASGYFYKEYSLSAASLLISAIISGGNFAF